MCIHRISVCIVSEKMGKRGSEMERGTMISVTEIQNERKATRTIRK